MAYAVISDVHSNLHALNAVMKDIERQSINEIYFTGDAVGYGPHPDSCIEIIKQHCKIILAGNHDWAVIGYTDIKYFNEYALSAVIWTQNIISEEHLNDLQKFNIVKSSKEHNAFFVHSTPNEPDKWNYLFSLSDAEINFRYFNQPICFIGHTHSPIIIEKLISGELLVHKNFVVINQQSRYIVNVGSVGQPRDRDPRASYAVINENTIDIVRIEYNIKRTQNEMAKVGLPIRLIERLSYGL